jgi:DNA primase
MALSEEFLERLKSANDIVTAFGNYSALKRAGSDFVCLCPFHSEKTASCHVYALNQSFYCFGCGAGGSVITFTQLTENLDFMGAVRLLAERSGIVMPDEDDESGKQELALRRRIYEMNREAGRFFINQLRQGGEGLAFLRNRGLSDDTIKRYGLGFAPDSWNALKYHLNGLGFTDSELIAASLLRSKDGKSYDFFRSRVMFPVIDRSGNVIAFSGRQIRDEDFGGKYVNSSETPVYRKGENLFSIHFAKNSKKKYMILCEGNIDAVMLNQAGFDNAVAVLGTAFTPAQARLLRHYCDEVVIACDSDSAGEKATIKIINILNKEGISARVLQLKGANDPDDYIKQFGAESFEKLVEKSGSVLSFEMDKLRRSLDMESPHGRAEFLKQGVALLSQVDNLYERTVYGSDLAKECGVTTVGVNDAIEAAIRNKKRFAAKEETRTLLRGVFDGAPGSPRPTGGVVGYDDHGVPNTVNKAEQGILAYLFHSPDKLPVILRSLSPGDFPTEFNRKLFETLILRLNKRQSIGRTALEGEFSAGEVGRIERIKHENADLPFDDRRLADYINVLTERKNSINKKPVTEMTDEELLEYTNSLREKKTVKI